MTTFVTTPTELKTHDYKTLALASLGGALELYDFVIFIFFAITISHLFFPPEMPEHFRQLQTFGIFAVGYIARPLGGIIMAHFGDLIGRKRMFTISIALMALPTLCMGLLPTYASIGIAAPILLLLLRVLQGAAIGAEVPGSWVFVSEHAPAKRMGFANGVLTGGLCGGILLGSLVAAGINSAFNTQEVNDFAWRIPFLLGGVFGILSIQLRRYLEETPVFLEMKAHKTLSKEIPLKSVLKNHRSEIIISMLLTWLHSAAIVVVILMTPSFLQTVYQLDFATTLFANSLAIVALVFGCVFVGILSDRIGPGLSLVLMALFLGISSYAFYHNLDANMSLDTLYLYYTLTGFGVGIIGAVPLIMMRLFPAAVRFTGASFSYNIAYAFFGGITPMIISHWMKISPMALSYYVLGLSMLALVMGSYLHFKRKL